MDHLLHQLPIFLPVLFWAGYHYYKDRRLPEPLSRLALAFGFGVGAFYLSGLMYWSLDLVNLRYNAYALAETNIPGLFAYSILAIGGIEEFAKLLPFLLFVIRFKDFNEPIDGIIYASFIALGFATLENIQYLHGATGAEAWARGFAGPLVHIVFASIWGYYIGRAFLCNRNRALTIVLAFVCTAIFHGFYDVVAIAMPAPASPAAAILITVVWIWRLWLIRDLRALPPGRCPPDLPYEDRQAK
jgi:RsiW-degrading membrane proteinase PrsW (M82 family)